MSGRSAMAVVAHHGLIGECDERINDVCLAFAEVFVRMAAGVIAGAKPAAIFSIPMRVRGCFFVVSFISAVSVKTGR